VGNQLKSKDMRGILIRCFVKIPLYILWFAGALTIIIPIMYWIISGYNWFDVFENINLIDE